ncbi:hypothetical protein LF1_55070 [Rubripirellula obstinata]|uniref:Uncharacterized protein n=1 Tax=Rubripirellula obstinata TaxID=406547 RepID=A0A5B1C7P1_9BACT|nr:hypothetical protein [Rubripirellula obstinata]KAA1257107.1 hypothetical protein LF1_55070 [Rubripirellula obstinata]
MTKYLEHGVLAELPSELSYLIEPALRYGQNQFDDDIFSFLDSATDIQMAELATIAERVQNNDHYADVNKFLDLYPITDHSECSCLYFLFGVLDHAGLNFD